MKTRLALLLLLGITTQAQATYKAPGMSQALIKHTRQAVACSRWLGRSPDIVMVADMSLKASKARLWVFYNGSLVIHNTVAQGQGVGFSNTPDSHKSSLGLYQIDNPYYSHNEQRWRLTGMTKGFNDNARKRSIVIHSAPYVSSSFAGRSYGCPAVSKHTLTQLNEYDLSNGILFIDGHNELLHKRLSACSKGKLQGFNYFWRTDKEKYRSPVGFIRGFGDPKKRYMYKGDGVLF